MPAAAGARMRPAAGWRRAARADHRPTSTRRSSTSSPPPEPPLGRTASSRSCAAGARRSCCATRYDGLPAYGAFAYLRAQDVLARVDELLAEGRLSSTGGAYPKLRSGVSVGVLASGGGTNLQALLDSVHGREVEIVAVGRDRPGAAALRACARAGDRDARSSRAPTTPTARRATPRSPTGSTRAASSSSCSPATWRCSTPAFVGRFRDRILNVHPSLLPAFPGLDAIEQAIEARETESRRHGPPRRRGRRHRPDRAPAGGRAAGATDPAEVHAALRPLEHELLPEAVRLFARGELGREAASSSSSSSPYPSSSSRSGSSKPSSSSSTTISSSSSSSNAITNSSMPAVAAAPAWGVGRT